MNPWQEIVQLVRISDAGAILRRYFVTNGFDGALAMLGLAVGFYVSDAVAVHTILSACVGTAIALMMSGVSSAFLSETAERQRELKELQSAMVADISLSLHTRAARLIPWLVACVNGLAPLLMAMIITIPLWLDILGVPLPFPPLQCAIGVAFMVIFLLGIFLGQVSGTFWLWSALRTLFIGVFTGTLILLIER
jgi:predicted membrane protein (TIGR00267 family)